MPSVLGNTHKEKFISLDIKKSFGEGKREEGRKGEGRGEHWQF